MANEFLDDPDFAASAPGATLRARPLGFVDVGVRGGIHPVVEPVAGATTVLAFEADREEARRLQAYYAPSAPWHDVVIEASALAERAGPTTLYLTSANTNASLRTVNRPFVDRYRMVKFQPAGSQRVLATTLDRVLAERYAHQPQHGEFIKLDTQGTEYEILSGARRTLSDRTVALLVEVWYGGTYAGQRLFADVELYLRSLGFSCYGTSLHYRSRKLLDKRREATRERLLWADAIFFKDPLPGGPGRLELSERHLHALFVCAALLSFYDFALELALETWADGQERRRIERFIRRRAALPRWQTVLAVLRLAGRVLTHPWRANLEVGAFVDGRRDAGNYEDVGGTVAR